MKRRTDISERDIELLLAGRAPEGDADLQELARFLSEAREAYPETPTGHLEAHHVAAMIEAAALVPDERTGTMMQRIVDGIRAMLGRRWAKVAAVALASLLAFSGVAVAGALPEPVQDAVAGVAAQVGIDLPDSTEADDADEDAQDEDADEADDADEDAQDEDADEADDAEEDAEADEADDDADEADEADDDEADDDAESPDVEDTEQPEADD